MARTDVPPVRQFGHGRVRRPRCGRAGALPVVARIAAGRPAGAVLNAGEAMAVATGGAVPEGADAVVPIEVVVHKDNRR